MKLSSRAEIQRLDYPETSWTSAYEEDTSMYERLPLGAIRILSLFPGNTQDDVACELVTFDLASVPAYEALSYCWGKSFNLAPIVLNGKDQMKRHNLVECLRTIRREDKERLIWVDALYINQADSNEKSEQVSLMPQIYRSAAKTLIWLGKDEPSASRRKTRFFGLNSQQHALVENLSPSVSLKLLNELAQDAHIRYSADNAIRACILQLVCENAWFERVWVVQETLLSRSASLVLGKIMIPWETVFLAAANYVSHATTCCHVDKVAKNEPYRIGITRNMKVVTRVLLSFQRIPLGTKNELLANLWMFRNRLATLDSDKVYGILGLIQSANITITPDYEKSVVDLCCSVVLEDIRVSGNLHALKGVRTKAQAPASWSTNWSSLDYWAEDQPRILTELYKPMYSASGHHTARVVEHCSPPRTIGVTGRIVDRIIYASGVLSFPFKKVEVLRITPLKRVLRVLQILKDVQRGALYIGGGSVFSAFWKTLMGGYFLPYRESQNLFHNIRSWKEQAYEPTIRRARAADCLAFLIWWLCREEGHYLEKLMAFESKNTHVPTSGLTEDQKNGMLSRLKKLSACRDINSSIVRATSGRCMFVTESGYVGLGPEHTEVQDHVAILLGGSTPFMLREVNRRPNPLVRGSKLSSQKATTQETRYTLLGDCYVHGCMDGERVKNEDVDEWPSLLIV